MMIWGVPEDWKRANVTFAFKKGKKEKPENYSSVSFTLILMKVMEQLILKAISKHMKNEKVIRSSNYGFRRG